MSFTPTDIEKLLRAFVSKSRQKTLRNQKAYEIKLGRRKRKFVEELKDASPEILAGLIFDLVKRIEDIEDKLYRVTDIRYPQ